MRTAMATLTTHVLPYDRFSSMTMIISPTLRRVATLFAAGKSAEGADERIIVPKTFMPSADAFTSFEQNMLHLIQRIPAESVEELGLKVATLIPASARVAALARAKEHSSDPDSYLVNLARHIASKNPQELDRKLLSLVPAVTAPPSDGRGSVCIVTRKPIHNITRAPRMAKALSDAGYRVVVVSPAPPVDDLRNMCPEVEYIVARYRAFTHDIVSKLEGRRRDREARLEKRTARYQQAIKTGGVRAGAARALSALTKNRLTAATGRALWNGLAVAPAALLLKHDSESLPEVRRNLVDNDVFEIAIKFISVLTQWASTHAFAAKADELTAGRHFDVVQAYDNYGLVAGARLAARSDAKLIYDAVEIATERLAQDLNVLEKCR